MARSFSSFNTLSSLFVNALTRASRRGYASTSSARGVGGSISGKMAKKSGEEKVINSEKVSWVPDPETGYYKPENSNEIDVAELRATLLGKKFNN